MKVAPRVANATVATALPKAGCLPTGDPLESLELEEGAEYEEAYEYMDGHIEIGRTRFTGEWKKIWVNQYEFTRLPILEALTELTPGPVRVLSRKKL